MSPAAKIVSVATGEAHTLLLTPNGDVFACGRNREGQLGVELRAAGSSKEPVLVESLRPWRVARIACGSKHSLAVSRSGRAFEWGLLLPAGGEGGAAEEDDEVGRRARGLGRDFEDLTARQQRIVAQSWSRYLMVGSEGDRGGGGDDDDGALRVLKQFERRRAPVGAPRPCAGLDGLRVWAAACGWAHSVVATREGLLRACGYNEKGQIGNGTRLPSAEFVAVSTPAGATAASEFESLHSGFAGTSILACGMNHSAAVLNPDGRLCTWGLGVFGQLGLGHAKKESCAPEIVPLNAAAVQVACGDHHTLVVTADHDVYTFGHKDSVGGGSHFRRLPEKQFELCGRTGARVDRVFAGGMGCFAAVGAPRRAEAEAEAAAAALMHSWGYNQRYALGQHSSQLALSRPAPVALPRLPGARVRAFAAGSHHAVLVLDAPRAAVLPPELGEPCLGSPALLRLLRGAAAYDVAVLAAGAALGAHRCVLRARSPRLAARLRPAPGAPEGGRPWELDLRGLGAPCAAALLAYLYTDHARAAADVAAGLQPLAAELGLGRLLAGISLATETPSEAEGGGLRWVRSAAGKWLQVEAGAGAGRAENAESTYCEDLSSLVVSAGEEGEPAAHPDFVELSARSLAGAAPRTVRVARPLLLTVSFFRALLEGGFAEAQHLRDGSLAPIEVLTDSPDAFILCLRMVATGDCQTLMPSDVDEILAVVAEAHRLELPDVLGAAEMALSGTLDLRRGGEPPVADSGLPSPGDFNSLAAIGSAAALYDLPKLAAEAEQVAEMCGATG